MEKGRAGKEKALNSERRTIAACLWIWGFFTLFLLLLTPLGEIFGWPKGLDFGISRETGGAFSGIPFLFLLVFSVAFRGIFSYLYLRKGLHPAKSSIRHSPRRMASRRKSRSSRGLKSKRVGLFDFWVKFLNPVNWGLVFLSGFSFGVGIVLCWWIFGTNELAFNYAWLAFISFAVLGFSPIIFFFLAFADLLAFWLIGLVVKKIYGGRETLLFHRGAFKAGGR